MVVAVRAGLVRMLESRKFGDTLMVAGGSVAVCTGRWPKDGQSKVGNGPLAGAKTFSDRAHGRKAEVA